jgi:hypothetical protein
MLQPSSSWRASFAWKMEICVEVIDVEAQAVQLQASAAVAAKSADRTTIFRGPYSSAAVSDRIEAAIIVALDQAQSGADGQLNLADVGVD